MESVAAHSPYHPVPGTVPHLRVAQTLLRSYHQSSEHQEHHIRESFKPPFPREFYGQTDILDTYIHMREWQDFLVEDEET
jgi:hypothetical protein